ncbi:MAG: 16S rRNA (guanine(527)-N(7))-methyltransferase RsmG [Myxococcales bacterium]|nr:16S rRNA (guanine(527)-N(7))-methyltransferase RsmG [Myxococcales bacterium]
MTWHDDVARAASALDVAAAAPRLVRFVELFERWNRRINLSAARTPAEITQHVIDSLAVIPHVRECDSIVDVGSGGGFPGLVIAIVLDRASIRCVEPLHKKTAFLSSVARELELSRLEVMTRRVDPAIDHDFDAATSRATFEISEWLTLGATLVRQGGIVLGMEGRERVDLGPTDSRHAYELADRQRAVIVRRVG